MTISVAVLTGVDRRLDFTDHLAERDHLLTLVVPAFFRRHLVLDVEGGDPGLFVFPDRADHVERVAVAGVGIGDHRDSHRLDRQPDKAHVLRERQQAEIGIAVRPRIAAAGQVDRLEAGLLDEPRGERVISAGHHRVPAALDQTAHLLPHRHRLSPFAVLPWISPEDNVAAARADRV